jgi:glycosyltransferase involved in cell wall biosynthesis
MASFNHADYIGMAIDSVRRQEGVEWELLIADDASTDHTLEVLKTFEHDARIRVFSFKNNRQHHMRNFAVQHAQGDYLAFLNSDDLYYPGKLEKQLSLLENNPHIAVVFTHVSAIDADGRRLHGHNAEKVFAVNNKTRQQWLRQFFMHNNSLCISSAMMRRDWFDQIGPFNPQLIQIADLDLWIKTCFEKEIHVIPEPLTGVRVLQSNLSKPSPASNARTFLETQQVFTLYFSPDGLKQAADIFPGLMESLPEDTPIWKAYFLSRVATTLQSKAMRLLGFTQQHALFKKEETKLYLQKNNPRLLRAFFLSEGCSGIGQNIPDVNWTIFLSESDSSQGINPLISSWTAFPGTHTVCLSFKNPKGSTPLYIEVSNQAGLFHCVRARCYSRQTGNLISDNALPKRQVFIRQRFRIPKIDFSKYSSTWIEMEIECSQLLPPILFFNVLKYKQTLLALRKAFRHIFKKM